MYKVHVCWFVFFLSYWNSFLLKGTSLKMLRWPEKASAENATKTWCNSRSCPTLPSATATECEMFPIEKNLAKGVCSRRKLNIWQKKLRFFFQFKMRKIIWGKKLYLYITVFSRCLARLREEASFNLCSLARIRVTALGNSNFVGMLRGSDGPSRLWL